MAIVRAGTDRSKILVQVKRGGGGGVHCTVGFGFRAEMTRKRVWARGYGSTFFQTLFPAALQLCSSNLRPETASHQAGTKCHFYHGICVIKILYEDKESESEGFRWKKIKEEKKIKEICTAKRRHRKQMEKEGERERADMVNKYKRDSVEGKKEIQKYNNLFFILMVLHYHTLLYF
jgi:hypothetical protein